MDTGGSVPCQPDVVHIPGKALLGRRSGVRMGSKDEGSDVLQSSS